MKNEKSPKQSQELTISVALNSSSLIPRRSGDSAPCWDQRAARGHPVIHSPYSVFRRLWFCLGSVPRRHCSLIFLRHLSFCFHCVLLFPYFSVQILERQKAGSPGNHAHLCLSRSSGIILRCHFFICEMGIIPLPILPSCCANLNRHCVQQLIRCLADNSLHTVIPSSPFPRSMHDAFSRTRGITGT